ncbi:Protocadherin-15 [Pelobates cultripes]|uniref:Protocadherin-15, partial n=1 Tax=Pelobates cultripes TaxID=61616 RepID=A0AAD1WTW9_PELCU|nr:Protocadherin-15 [Pelobates cultripes]
MALYTKNVNIAISYISRPSPVSEAAPFGTAVTVVTAAALNQTIVYSIVSGNDQGMFAIDNITGVISVVRPLDYENTTSYQLRIQADSMQVVRFNLRAASKSNTAVVFIEIQDENDHAPVFSKKTYLGGVSEDARMFASVLKVKTTDRDTGNYSTNSYKLVVPQISNSKEGFVIEVYSGIIKTAMLFKNMRRSYFKFEVIATDDYGKGLSSKADVVVSVVNQLDMQVIVSNVPPTVIEENIDDLISILERYVQDQIPGAAVVVESIGARRYGDGFSEEDYTQSDLMIYAVDPQTNRAISRNELFKFLDGKVLDINKQFQDYIGQGGRILEIRTPDVVANVKKQAQAVGYTEGALLALAIIIILCCIPAILIVMVSYRQRQAECAKTARIQMAMPAGKPSTPAANNLYEELGDSTIKENEKEQYFRLSIMHLFLLYHFQQSRGKKSVLQDGDRQRLISNLASRAIEAHKQSTVSGCLNNNLPKSSSNVTFLSDTNPLTTKNPLYVEGACQSPDSPGLIWKHDFLLDKSSSQRSMVKDALLQINCEGKQRAWTLPACLTKRHFYDVLHSPVIMDPIQGQQKYVQPECETAETLKGTESPRPLLEKSTNGKLTVKEQARQFEQNVLQEVKQGKIYETKDLHFTSEISYNQDCIEKHSKPLADFSSQNSPFSSSQDISGDHRFEASIFPTIVITPSEYTEEISPPPTRKPTPPLIKKNVAPGNMFLTTENIHRIEQIPDPPSIPPPLPPSTSPVANPSSIPPLCSTPTHITTVIHDQASHTTPPPPPLQAPSLPPPLLVQPNIPSLPAPPPLPAPPLPQQLLTSNSQHSITSLTATTLSNVRDKLSPLTLLPPEAPRHEHGPRRELKGILKNIHNLADIEKSVANMYSQIDKGNVLSKQTTKAKSIAVADVSIVEALPEHEKHNGNLGCVVEELEKKFPSQSTAL